MFRIGATYTAISLHICVIHVLLFEMFQEILSELINNADMHAECGQLDTTLAQFHLPVCVYLSILSNYLPLSGCKGRVVHNKRRRRKKRKKSLQIQKGFLKSWKWQYKRRAPRKKMCKQYRNIYHENNDYRVKSWKYMKYYPI